MPSAFTSWGQGQFLNICLNLASPPASFWLALCTDEPGIDADGTTIADLEPDSAAGYARVEIPVDSANWTNALGTTYATNIFDITFPTPTDIWGVINHFALCSLDTAGEVYIYGEFDVSSEVDTTAPFLIPAGGIVIVFSSVLPSIVAI